MLLNYHIGCIVLGLLCVGVRVRFVCGGIRAAGCFSRLVLHAIMWRRRWRRKRWNMWVRPINIKRPDFEIFSHLYPDLLTDEKKFHGGFFRMNIEQFYRLSQLVGEEIQ